MTINVGILGYGNLGKAVEIQLLQEKNIKLVGIFTKRENTISKYNTPVYSRQNLLNFVHKIDILVLCSGSQSDMLYDAPFYTKHFNTINTFDTHSLISQMFIKLNKIAKTNNHIAILSTGWDPGLFSYIKAIFSTILNTSCICFWGKGVSMGHSQAVKQIPNVCNAISYTIPNKKAKKLAIKGLQPNSDLHSRLVYIVAKHSKYKKSIKKLVLNMPHYFKGQKVAINFVNSKRLNKIKVLSHKGEIICSTKDNYLHLKISLKSNPQFTACIVASYVRAFKNIKNKYTSGAYTPLHFSPMDLSLLTELQTIKKYC